MYNLFWDNYVQYTASQFPIETEEAFVLAAMSFCLHHSQRAMKLLSLTEDISDLNEKPTAQFLHGSYD